MVFIDCLLSFSCLSRIVCKCHNYKSLILCRHRGTFEWNIQHSNIDVSSTQECVACVKCDMIGFRFRPVASAVLFRFVFFVKKYPFRAISERRKRNYPQNESFDVLIALDRWFTLPQTRSSIECSKLFNKHVFICDNMCSKWFRLMQNIIVATSSPHFKHLHPSQFSAWQKQ